MLKIVYSNKSNLSSARRILEVKMEIIIMFFKVNSFDLFNDLRMS
jgi:hypothetical protein